MNNTTFGNSPLLLNSSLRPMPNVVSLFIRLPVNIYILQIIISRHWITSEFYALKGAVLEIAICLYDFLGMALYFNPNIYLLLRIKRLFLGFLVTGRPLLLAVICVQRYLAVVKPVVFLRLKPLKYKLVLSGMIWLLTLISCWGAFNMNVVFHFSVTVQMAACILVKLYCCVATLQALKKPGPGEGGRQREGMSDTKQKAFRIILIITLSVILTSVPLMVVTVLKYYFTMDVFLFAISVCYSCTDLPGLVLALLFLQRCGKLPRTKWP